MNTPYSRDKNDILFLEEEGKPLVKVAEIDAKGLLKMSRGMKDHREAVEAYLEEIGAEAPEDDEEEEDRKEKVVKGPRTAKAAASEQELARLEEAGRQAFRAGELQATNPHRCDREPARYQAWIDGYLDEKAAAARKWV